MGTALSQTKRMVLAKSEVESTSDASDIEQVEPRVVLDQTASRYGDPASVARALIDQADTLTEHFDIDVNLRHLVEACQQVIRGADVSAVIAEGSDTIRVAASSSERKMVIEQYQIDHDEGPTVDALRLGQPGYTRVPDGDVQQWPLFAKLAEIVGYTTFQSFPLRHRDETIGVLSISEASGSACTPLQNALIQALADGTTIGIFNHRAYMAANEVSRQLQGALNSRVLIEQSKGAVSVRLGITVDEAFDKLRRYARSSNDTLNNVCQAIMTGNLATHDLWDGHKPRASRGPASSELPNG